MEFPSILVSGVINCQAAFQVPFARDEPGLVRCCWGGFTPMESVHPPVHFPRFPVPFADGQRGLSGLLRHGWMFLGLVAFAGCLCRNLTLIFFRSMNSVAITVIRSFFQPMAIATLHCP